MTPSSPSYLSYYLLAFSITPEQLAKHVSDYLSSAAVTGWANLGATLGALKGTELRWANPLELKNAVESAFLEKFGPKETAKPKGKVSRFCIEPCWCIH